MRAERLIKILLLLQHGKIVSAREISKELEVSERTIYRDMEALSAAGIPIYSERGQAGGWRLVDNWKQKLSWLKEKEMLTLFLPHAEKIINDLGIGPSSKDTTEKLLLSLPEEIKQSAEKLWERVHVDMGTWRNTKIEINPAMKVMKEAVMNNKKVKIFYQKANLETKEYVIKPLGLVAKSSNWYVVSMNSHDEFRNYKITRITECDLMDEQFNRPCDFKLFEHWEEAKKQFVQSLPEFHVKVAVSSFALERIKFTGRFVQAGAEKVRDHYWTELELTFNTEEEAVNFIVGFGNQVKVLSPLNFIDKVKDRAKAILGLYR
ncbi:YafY family protein [Halobacillus sp. BAB-2008]|uniref:helix-turn-helix transcriptional regulator n=1 Tax=Halobacillus sp. BAB-2008 TaxID=1246484 RepID=UPI0002A4D289|nr:YafY family protein [Halobacillus sp. BAB-2008]ELK47702.1 DNA-binding protein [Halobacillus sp. BAB-2008]